MEKEDNKLDVVSIRLVKDSVLMSEHRIMNPGEAVDLIGDFMCELDREHVCVLNLNGSGKPINFNIASIGTINQSMVSVKDLLKSAILCNAPTIMVFHNHPSGSLEPSQEDFQVTRKIREACRIMDIHFLDHIIIAGGSNREYFSFCENKIMANPYKKDFSETEDAGSVASGTIAREENAKIRKHRER